MKQTHTDVTLDSGAVVRCRPIPPHATRPVIAQFERPRVPNVEIKSASGASETAVALPETPEWEAFVKAQADYQRAVADALDDFMLSYGIMGWKLDGADGEWSNSPPNGWRVPGVMKRYGVEDSDDPWEQRLHFIRYGLVLTDADADKVDKACMITPLTEEEVEVAAVPFDSDAPTEPAHSSR